MRLAVEEKLKQGELKAIVATGTLELGIDIGHLDHVVMVDNIVMTVASAIQRIGRAGHIVGEISRGTFVSLSTMGILGTGIMAKAVIEQEIEPLKMIRNPLDLLAQIIISITAYEKWDIDELYALIKTSYPLQFLLINQV